jgi:hypothetical protein
MADNLSPTISTYQQRLITMPSVPATFYGCSTLGEEGVANKLLITFISDKNVGIQFLKDVGGFQMGVSEKGICFPMPCFYLLSRTVHG